MDVEAEFCPACGHAMTVHHGRHCKVCDEAGETCAALEPAVESPGG
jgi:NADH pyrophosphatase NudC (nudix superfamily)